MKRLLVASGLLVFSMFLSVGPASAGVVNATDKTYYDEVIRTYDPVVLEFWAPWCGYCRKMAPEVDELAKEYEGKMKVVKIDTSDNSETAKKYKVDGIPAFFLVKDGQVVSKAVGYCSKEQLKKKLGLK